MKQLLNPRGIWLAGSLLICMTVILLIQHHAIDRLRDQNRVLQEEIEQLGARTGQLKEEKDLQPSQSGPSAPTEGAYAGALEREPYLELLRLRGQVGRLHRYDQEAEQAHREQMDAAKADLPQAEAALARVTQLRSQGFVTDADVAQARWAAEALKAQAQGDMAAAAQIRSRAKLAKAEAELQTARGWHAKGFVTAEHVDRVGLKVDLLNAEARGDMAEVARIRLRLAEGELSHAAELRRKGLINQAEYEQAVRTFESARPQ